jgi:hypothetical protein
MAVAPVRYFEEKGRRGGEPLLPFIMPLPQSPISYCGYLGGHPLRVA